jgi:hypothetical protein
MPKLSESNVTDKTYLDYYKKYHTAKKVHEEDVDTARSSGSVVRDILKDAKKAGVDTTAITRAFADVKLDREDVIASQRAYIRMLAISSVIPNIQQELFGETPKSDLTDEDRSGMANQRAFDDGQFAGVQGHSPTLNPHPLGTDLQDSWHRGHVLGQAKIAGEMAPKKKAVATPRKGKLDPKVEQHQAAH